jgi:hypothetical protein
MRHLAENAVTSRDISQVLSTRATKVLQELGVHKVGQLQELNPSRIKPILGAGPKTIREIVVFQERLLGGPYKHPAIEEIEEVNPDAHALDGLEDALIGYADAGRTDEYECPVALYDRDKCVTLIMDRGNTREDAEEHLRRKTLPRLEALGENAPILVVRKEGELGLDDLARLNPIARLADGFEDAFIGHTDPAQGINAVAVYDSERCVRIIIKKGIARTTEDAEDYLSYNVYRALPHYGEDAPIFVKSPD